jgi:hypothetical protein
MTRWKKRHQMRLSVYENFLTKNTFTLMLKIVGVVASLEGVLLMDFL